MFFNPLPNKTYMEIRSLHNWDLSYADARKLQTQLSVRVEFVPFKPKEPFLVAGLDCAFSGDGKKVVAAIVVMQVREFKIVETASHICKVSFPYIPGLLSFREAPACIAAAEKLKSEPDLIIVDGQGVAHPRRLGIAAHLGLVFDRPTIGCAKSRLIGEHGTLGKNKGACSFLTDKDEVIGAIVRTRRDVKPVYVSVGNKCLLEDAVQLVLRCAVRYRLPEPTRLAHQLVTKLKKAL
jgi:deoxyribonuclease V